MIKSTLIERITLKQQVLTDQDVERGVNQIVDFLCTALCRGVRIELRGFGSFCLRYQKPRNAHNPRTGEKLVTLPKYRPHFKPGKALRERVDKSRRRVLSP